MKLTLNCDMGEQSGFDSQVMPHIDLANIACGGHAGDSATMLQTLKLAKRHNVKPGAHPGYPDKENFGRRSLDVPPAEITAFCVDQIKALKTIAERCQLELRYVKAHGALNNDMCRKDEIFAAVCEAVAAFTGYKIMVPLTLKIDRLQAIAKEYKLAVVWEVFADRLYEKDGSLTPRTNPLAVHHDKKIILQQVRLIKEHKKIMAGDHALDVSLAETICIHGDNLASIAAAYKIKTILDEHT